MSLTDLAKWRQEHPKEPLYECANINNAIHLVAHASHRTVATRCGIKADTQHYLLAFMLPAVMVTCPECRKGSNFRL